jgi:hypothetical protein
MDEFKDFEMEWSGRESAAAREAGAPFTELHEMELAAELLEANREAELDRFVNGLLREAAAASGGFLNPSVGKALGSLVKQTIKKAWPAAGGLAEGVRGRTAGSQAGGRASRLLGLELEGLSSEDQEFEVAKRLVRLAGAGVQKAARTPGPAIPIAVAKRAVAEAAREHAPGLLKPAVANRDPGKGECGCNGCHRCNAQAGRWTRRGREIILDGL